MRVLEDAISFIEEMYQKSYKINNFGLYLVVDKILNNTSVGVCGLVKRDLLEIADLGFAFLEKYCKKGYGFESAQAILSFANNDLGLNEIAAITSIDNLPSIGLLKKLSFKFHKTIDYSETEKVSLFLLKF